MLSCFKNCATIFVYWLRYRVWFLSLEKYTSGDTYHFKHQYMNIRLEKLFLEHNLSQKDCYEIRQIYQFLPVQKRQNLLDNFETIVGNIQKINQEIFTEQEVLLGKTLTSIEQEVSQLRKQKISQSAGYELSDLKKQI